MLLLLVACAPVGDDSTAPTSVDYAAPGPWSAGRHTAGLLDPARDRALTVEVWYPTDAEAVDDPVPAFVVDPDDRATYEALLDAAPADCPSRTTRVTPEASVAAGGPWPLVAMSHCHGCTRFSTASVAAHLATHGFVVVAPDHAGNTLFDELAGEGLPLDTDTLALREADLAFALDAAVAGDLGPAVDPARVGAFGHSFGAITAAKLLQDRLGGTGAPRAAMLVGAPPENPLLPGVSMAALEAPLLFEILAEDHSIGAAGNLLVEGNFEDAPGPAWLVEMADAGHWSPSDLVALVDDFDPGCGEDTREATGEPFTYLPAAEGRGATAQVAATFFAGTLLDRPEALDALGALGAPLSVTAR